MSVGSTNFPGSLDTALDLVEVANKASTTVSGGTLNSGNTTVTVASTASFTSSGIIGINDELIAYTGKTATTFTGCTRAFESTTAASHADGAAVKQYITAASHNVQSAAIIAIETKVGSGSSTPAVNTVLTGSGTGASAWGQVTNAMLAGSIQASKLVGTDIATVGTITSGTLSTGTVLGGVTVTLGSDATGDIYYRNSGGVLTRLGIGTTGQVLTVASGLPSWASVTASAGGTNTQLQYNSSNSLAGISGATSNGTNVTFGSGNLIATSPSITTSLTTGSTSFDLINTTATTVNFAGAATTLNMAGGSGAVINLGGGANAAELRFLEPSGSGTNYTALKAQAQAANVTYTLPAADGTSGQVLSTNGSGTLSWATASGGGGGTPGGSSGQVQYNDSGAFNGSSLFTFSASASPTVAIKANAITSNALDLSGNASQTAPVLLIRQISEHSAPLLTLRQSALSTYATSYPFRLEGDTGTLRLGMYMNPNNAIYQFVAPGAASGSPSYAVGPTSGSGFGAVGGSPTVLADGAQLFWGNGATGFTVFNQGYQVAWGSNATSYDVGLRRAASGVLQVTNGSSSAGQLLIAPSATTAAAQLHVVSGSASRVGLRVDSAASPTADIAQFTVNGTLGAAINKDGRVLLAERSSNPTGADLTSGGNAIDRVAMYMINDKIVFAMNDGAGNVNYLSIAVNGSATAWAVGAP